MDPILAALGRAVESGLLPSGARVLLAVSGGPDSMALFWGCLDVGSTAAWDLAVAHVHHGLRGRDADRDLAFVRDQARRAGLPFFLRRRDASDAARALGISPEAAARHVRYEALAEMAGDAGCSRIAVAHQKNDVAESVLLARSRRGGVASLGGPREWRADGVVRPLLEISRREILSFLEARGVGYRRDGSNGDLRRTRNRVRRELAGSRIPAGDAVETLALEARRHAAARERVERRLEREAVDHVAVSAGITVADAVWLAASDRELARRALERAATPFARAGRPPLTGREREQILDRLAASGDFRFEAGRRIRFERRGALLRVYPTPARPTRVDTAARPA